MELGLFGFLMESRQSKRNSIYRNINIKFLVGSQEEILFGFIKKKGEGSIKKIN